MLFIWKPGRSGVLEDDGAGDHPAPHEGRLGTCRCRQVDDGCGREENDESQAEQSGRGCPRDPHVPLDTTLRGGQFVHVFVYAFASQLGCR